MGEGDFPNSSVGHPKGVGLSEEHKQKISSALKGRKPKNFNLFMRKAKMARVGKEPWNKGLTNETDERVKHISESKIKPNRLVDGYVQNRNIRKHKEVFCGWIGLKEIPLGYVVHHIDGNKLNNDISNLIMLTRSEHAKLHSEVDMIIGTKKGLFKQKYFEKNKCSCGKEIGRKAIRCKSCNNTYYNKLKLRGRGCKK